MQNTSKIAIVIIAYNREKSLQRLLDSLSQVDYEGFSVPLIVSIDYSGKSDVQRAAESFEWKYGEKRIIAHDKNLGLRKHVLSCGELVREYDALIVLEDDLLVSPAMFSYARRAVEHYQGDSNIAGISLYAKEWNETAWEPFAPAYSGRDTYFIQTAESLGQIWMREQWLQFSEWYSKNNESFGIMPGIPANVCIWDDRSWKKYHIRYCIEENKYTVYPYFALTTCTEDVGEHVKENSFMHQVRIAEGSRKEFDFADVDDAGAIKYDSFLERVIPDFRDTCLDLYGQKKDFGTARYVISSQIMDCKIVGSYARALRPHEENIIHKISGREFFKYDLLQPERGGAVKHAEKELQYYHYASFQGVANRMRIVELISALFRVTHHRIKKVFRRN